jgi:hypothetical protein
MWARKYSPYSAWFARKRVYTYALRNPIYFKQLIDAGFAWISREEKPFLDTLRNPTLGCIVELFVTPRPHAIRIDSKEGQQLLKKLCYY